MRSLKTLLMLLLVSVLLVGCASTNNTYAPIEPEPKQPPKVSLQIIYMHVTMYSYEIRLRFKEWSDEYTGVIQELIMNNGYKLVEYFELVNGEFAYSTFDKHSAKFIKGSHIRYMRIYPAKVEGLDMRNNFGQLPKNRTGSVVTKISPLFNKRYQDNFKTQGKVIEDDRENSIYWSSYFQDGVLRIVLPDKTEIRIGSTHTAKQ